MKRTGIVHSSVGDFMYYFEKIRVVEFLVQACYNSPDEKAIREGVKDNAKKM